MYPWTFPKLVFVSCYARRYEGISKEHGLILLPCAWPSMDSSMIDCHIKKESKRKRLISWKEGNVLSWKDSLGSKERFSGWQSYESSKMNSLETTPFQAYLVSKHGRDYFWHHSKDFRMPYKSKKPIISCRWTTLINRKQTSLNLPNTSFYLDIGGLMQ